jgi:hypothetical protein
MGAFHAETLETTTQTYYRPEFDLLRKDLSMDFSVADNINRIIVTSVVLAPLVFQMVTEDLDKQLAKSRIVLDNDGRFYVDVHSSGTLLFYLVLPVSVLLGEQEKPPRRRRSRRRGRTEKKGSATPNFKLLQQRLEECVQHGRYEEAAKLRDELRAMRGEAPE